MFVMFKKKLFSILALLSFSASILAWNVSDDWYLGGGIGSKFQDIKNPKITTGTTTPDDIYLTDKKNPDALFFVNFGRSWPFDNSWKKNPNSKFFNNIGIDFSYSFSPSKAHGIVEKYSDPVFRNYDFNYKLQSHTFMVQGILDVYKHNLFIPYVSVGLGFSLNSFSDYSESARSGVSMPRINPDFSDKIDFIPIYQVGLGVYINLDRRLRLNFGYRFGHSGDFESGSGKDAYDAVNLKNRTELHQTLIVGINYLLTKNNKG